jgi:hypothetical protein
MKKRKKLSKSYSSKSYSNSAKKTHFLNVPLSSIKSTLMRGGRRL